MVTMLGIMVHSWPSVPRVVFAMPIDLFLTLFLLTLSAQMLGLAISALAPDNTSALEAAPLLLIYQLIVSGALVEIPNLPAFFPSTAICRWGVGALGSVLGISSLPLSVAKELKGKLPDGISLAIPDNINFDATNVHLLGAWQAMLVLAAAGVAIAAVWLYILQRRHR